MIKMTVYIRKRDGIITKYTRDEAKKIIEKELAGKYCFKCKSTYSTDYIKCLRCRIVLPPLYDEM